MSINTINFLYLFYFIDRLVLAPLSQTKRKEKLNYANNILLNTILAYLRC